MDALQAVNLRSLMRLSEGIPEVSVGVVDGPVDLSHADFSESDIRELAGAIPASCSKTQTIACAHGTYVAGMLSARRGSSAPAICPGCTVLVRPVFSEDSPRADQIPTATLGELATAIFDCLSRRR